MEIQRKSTRFAISFQVANPSPEADRLAMAGPWRKSINSM